MKKKILVTFAAVFFGVLSAKADEYYVNADSGNDDWDGTSPTFLGGSVGPNATIQAAIDATVDNDIVIVADGTYSGIGNRDIQFYGRVITLQSENGPDYCIIDSQGTQSSPHRALYLDANSIVDGLTTTNGFAWGGGIFCANSSPTIRNCIVSLNSSQGKGGGIACDYANPIIDNCIISDNWANDGGGIYCYQSSPEILNCTISDNYTWDNYNGGGICCEGDSNLTIENSMIYGNLSENLGGGLYCDASSTHIINSLIVGNNANSHGAGVYCSNSTVTITNCTVSGNTAAWIGGGIRCYNNGDVTVKNSIFWNNQIVNENGIGPEIALADNSALTISYSNVQGDQNAVSKEFDCTLSWDDSNIDADPDFTQEGYWDINNTSEDTSDDFWVDGDYRLLVGSPCIDKGNNDFLADYYYDIAGNDRIVSGIIDMGAYESGGLQISKFSVKAGKVNADKTRQAQSDSFSISGSFDATEQDVDNQDINVHIILTEGMYEETISPNSDMFKKDSRKPIYTYKRSLVKGETGGITSMKFDLLKGTYSISAKQIVLSGLQAPVPVEIEIGNYYRSAIIGETDINGRKPLPIQFLFGQTDSIRVDKYRFKPAKNPGTGSDSLMVMGAIAVEDAEMDLSGQEVTVRWGTFEANIPPGSEGLLPKGTKYFYKKPKILDVPSVNYVDLAIFDLVKCAFMIQVKNADIGFQPDSVNFSIEFASFDESDTVP
ncbi:MAG: right-handed parallel beta-helix repeat-containing protein [Dehalococcoidia bacterium]|nr:right-handed parallel beta-helix repeat-containing protein [Dehalococcoidia bacterium]